MGKSKVVIPKDVAEAIEKAVQHIAIQRVLETDVTTDGELLHEIRQIRREIIDVLSVRGQ